MNYIINTIQKYDLSISMQKYCQYYKDVKKEKFHKN
jgi:hypothetical protein